jgi:MFS family permease
MLGHDTEPRASGRDWLGLAVTLVATFMGWLDVFIVNVAMPSIRTELRVDVARVQFVVAGYTVAYAVALITGSRLGDAFGRRRVFRLGVAAFSLASLLCSAARTVDTLIAARIVQGLAAGMMLPQVLSMVRATFPERQREFAVGLYLGVIGLATVTGQLVGGALITADVAGVGWRGIFLVNVPLGLFVVLVAGRSVPESRAPNVPRLDVVGSALLALALPAILVPLALGLRRGWPLPYWASLCSGLLLCAVFYGYEVRLAGRGGCPLLPPRLLHTAQFRLGMGVVLAFYSGNAGLMLLLAFYLQSGLRQSPLASGMEFAPLGAGFAVASLLVRRGAGRAAGRILVFGAMLMALALVVALVVLRMPAPRQSVPLALTLAASGFGQGLVAAPLITTILASVLDEDAGAVSGALLTMVHVSSSLGVAVLGGLYTRLLQGGTPGSDWQRHLHAFTLSVWVVMALALATAALAHQLCSSKEGSYEQPAFQQSR